MIGKKRHQYLTISLLCAASLAACQVGQGPSNYLCRQQDGSYTNTPNCTANQVSGNNPSSTISQPSAQPSSTTTTSPAPAASGSTSPSGQPGIASPPPPISGQPATLNLTVLIPNDAFSVAQEAQTTATLSVSYDFEHKSISLQANQTSVPVVLDKLKSGKNYVSLSLERDGLKAYDRTFQISTDPGVNTATYSLKDGGLRKEGQNAPSSAPLTFNATLQSTPNVQGVPIGPPPPGRYAFGCGGSLGLDGLVGPPSPQQQSIIDSFNRALDHDAGGLGPIKDGSCTIRRTNDNRGYKLEFQSVEGRSGVDGLLIMKDGGSIFRVHGDIYKYYVNGRGTEGFGYPLDGEKAGYPFDGVPSAFQKFDGSGRPRIVWSQKYGTRKMYEGFFTEWYNTTVLKKDPSIGFPTSDERDNNVDTGDSTSRAGSRQEFSGGTIFWFKDSAHIKINNRPLKYYTYDKNPNVRIVSIPLNGNYCFDNSIRPYRLYDHVALATSLYGKSPIAGINGDYEHAYKPISSPDGQNISRGIDYSGEFKELRSSVRISSDGKRAAIGRGKINTNDWYTVVGGGPKLTKRDPQTGVVTSTVNDPVTCYADMERTPAKAIDCNKYSVCEIDESKKATRTSYFEDIYKPDQKGTCYKTSNWNGEPFSPLGVDDFRRGSGNGQSLVAITPYDEILIASAEGYPLRVGDLDSGQTKDGIRLDEFVKVLTDSLDAVGVMKFDGGPEASIFLNAEGFGYPYGGYKSGFYPDPNDQTRKDHQKSDNPSALLVYNRSTCPY